MEEEEEDERVAEDEDRRQGMRARALPVDGDPDFDSGPPVDGFEYLRRVRPRGQKRAGGDGISNDRSAGVRSQTNAWLRAGARRLRATEMSGLPGRIRIGNGSFLPTSPTFACGCRGRRRGRDVWPIGRRWEGLALASQAALERMDDLNEPEGVSFDTLIRSDEVSAAAAFRAHARALASAVC